MDFSKHWFDERGFGEYALCPFFADATGDPCRRGNSR